MNVYIITTDNGGYAEYVYGTIAENDEEAFFIYKESDDFLYKEPYDIVDNNGSYKIYSKVYGTVYVKVFKLELEEYKLTLLGGYAE